MPANRLIMVRPACFGSNPETLRDNVFQMHGVADDHVPHDAKKEFDGMVALLRSKEIEILVFDDHPDPKTPDAVFPNNWFSTHPNGNIVLYPMMSKVRRQERRDDLLIHMRNQFNVTQVHDLSTNELDNHFLEGTGSMVLDHQAKIAFMCLSERSSENVLGDFCNKMGFKPFVFNSIIDEKPVYHTNVIMGVGTDFVIACVESITEQKAFRETVKKANKELIEIAIDQVRAFLGNCLEVVSKNGDKYLIVSQQAFLTLTNDQKDRLSKFVTLLPVSIPTIEKYGGGSVRCMIAENYLSKKDQQVDA